MGLLQPLKKVRTIHELTVDYFKAIGVKYLLVDMDNTLLPWHCKEISEEVYDWVNEIRHSDIGICVITNSQKERARRVMRRLDVPVIWNALKPLPFGFIRARKRIEGVKEKCVVIGDQIFTDVIGANLVGFR
ncbi:MAG: YqeG family HAD IIIA-type phosphatase, partial [Halanaerobiales bacterium]|nr:YqeG family HAD IIIA-type phosphatase [Halanaerobiales bacterium]